MKEHEREQLLERVDRDGATVGRSIPDTIEINGDEFELHDFVFETKKQDSVSEETEEKVEDVKKTLRRARNRRLDSIKSENITYEEGEEIAEEVIGIDRALNALGKLDSTDIEKRIKRKEAADKKRWLDFLDDALDTDMSKFS